MGDPMRCGVCGQRFCGALFVAESECDLDAEPAGDGGECETCGGCRDLCEGHEAGEQP